MKFSIIISIYKNIQYLELVLKSIFKQSFNNFEIIIAEYFESDFLIKEAKGKTIALLVYGSPLFATTHISLVLDAREQGIDVRVLYNASVYDAVAETFELEYTPLESIVS